MITDKIKARGKDISPLEGHDRLQYLVDLARDVPPLSNKHKTDENKIRGCASNLWVVGEVNRYNKMYYEYDADAEGYKHKNAMGVAYTDLIPVLVKAIQELSAKITALENA